ncbi:MAG: putative LPS assembly protein LptD [Bilophila wadsworthia]
MVLPAKTTRQSGLLPPDYGISDKRGFYYTQPYFWAIDESHDMTFYGGWMTKIGPSLSVEYRANEFTDQKTGSPPPASTIRIPWRFQGRAG